MRRSHLFVMFCLTFGLVWLSPHAAQADCAGPTFSHQVGEFNHGDTLTVEGLYWGDNCYDTGPPPAGEGDIGLPIADIDIVLVQGDIEFLVANGNADDRYEFRVDVVVPSGFEPGTFVVEARTGGSLGSGYNLTEELPTYSPSDKMEVTVTEVTFGPSEPVTAIGEVDTGVGSEQEGEVEPPADNGSNLIWLLGAVLVAAVIAAAVLVARRR